MSTRFTFHWFDGDERKSTPPIDADTPQQAVQVLKAFGYLPEAIPDAVFDNHGQKPTRGSEASTASPLSSDDCHE